MILIISLGAEGRVFLTKEDAKRYIKDPGKFEELACLRSKQFVRRRALTKVTMPKERVAHQRRITDSWTLMMRRFLGRSIFLINQGKPVTSAIMTCSNPAGKSSLSNTTISVQMERKFQLEMMRRNAHRARIRALRQ